MPTDTGLWHTSAAALLGCLNWHSLLFAHVGTEQHLLVEVQFPTNILKFFRQVYPTMQTNSSKTGSQSSWFEALIDQDPSITLVGKCSQ